MNLESTAEILFYGAEANRLYGCTSNSVNLRLQEVLSNPESSLFSVSDFYLAYQANKVVKNTAFDKALASRVMDKWSKQFQVSTMSFDGQPKGASLESMQALELMAYVLQTHSDTALSKLVKQATTKLLKEAAGTTNNEGQDF